MSVCTLPFLFLWGTLLHLVSAFLQAVHMEHDRKMDHPSNGVSIVGCLRPAFADEELYLRRLFHFEDNDGYTLDWKGFLY